MKRKVIITIVVALVGTLALFIAATNLVFHAARERVHSRQSPAQEVNINPGTAFTNEGAAKRTPPESIQGAQSSTPGFAISPTPNAEYSQFSNIMKQCINKGSERGGCMDAYTKNFLASFSVKDALALVQQGMNSDRTMLVQCHDMAHSIGREAFSKYTQVDEAFEACDQTCHSGCYHGVMERVFIPRGSEADHVDEENLKKKIPTICAPHEGQPIRFKFQCLHGIGHAIMFLLDNNLVKSMAACDLMPSYYDQSSCWGGVLMENVTSFEKSTRWIRRDDPHYPCNALDLKYRDICYIMQTSIMFENGLSPEKIVEECRNAGSARLVCMQSLGRDISSNTRNNFPYGVGVCNPLPDDERYACFQGILYAFMDLTWDGQYAFGFCDGLPREEDKSPCYERSVQYLRTNLGIEKNAVTGYCAAQSKNTELCNRYAE